MKEPNLKRKWLPLDVPAPQGLRHRWVACSTGKRRDLIIGLQFRNDGEWGKIREGYKPVSWLHPKSGGFAE